MKEMALISAASTFCTSDSARLHKSIGYNKIKACDSNWHNMRVKRACLPDTGVKNYFSNTGSMVNF
jgi:hypothetical protein